LPLPEGPTMAMVCFAGTAKVMSLRILTGRPAAGRTIETRFTHIMKYLAPLRIYFPRMLLYCTKRLRVSYLELMSSLSIIRRLFLIGVMLVYPLSDPAHPAAED